MISFCTHMPSWKGGQGRAGGQEVVQFAHTPSFILCTTSSAGPCHRHRIVSGGPGDGRPKGLGEGLGWAERTKAQAWVEGAEPWGGPATASQERKKHPVNKRLPREAGALGGRKKAGHLDGLARNGRKVGDGRSESGENCPGQGNRKGGEAGRKRNLPIDLSPMNALLGAEPGGEPRHQAAL